MTLEPTALETTALELGLSTEDHADLRARYAEPARLYHDWTHIQALAAVARTLDWQAPVPVWLALFYHDAVYVPGRGDNERRSRDLMVQRLSGRIRDEDLAVAAALIDATRTHEVGDQLPAPVRHDMELFLDIDMGILGSPPERYRAYARQIRLEHRKVPRPLYNRGRARVLAEFLGRERLYLSERFRRELDGPARRNLRWELEEGLGRPGRKALSVGM